MSWGGGDARARARGFARLVDVVSRRRSAGFDLLKAVKVGVQMGESSRWSAAGTEMRQGPKWATVGHEAPDVRGRKLVQGAVGC